MIDAVYRWGQNAVKRNLRKFSEPKRPIRRPLHINRRYETPIESLALEGA